MSRRPALGLAASALIALLASAALAAEAEKKDPDLPPIDPLDHWHLMTQNPMTTTSKCVGKPKSALCAIETFLACVVRSENKLCRIARDDPNLKDQNMLPRWSSKYRVVWAKRVSASDLPEEETRDLPWPWKLGDIRVGVWNIDCYKEDKPPCGTPASNLMVPISSYVVRKVGDHWRLVDWQATSH